MPGKLKTKVGELGRVCTRCKTYNYGWNLGFKHLAQMVIHHVASIVVGRDNEVQINERLD